MSTETKEEPQNVHREEGQCASVSTPMVTSRVYERYVLDCSFTFSAAVAVVLHVLEDEIALPVELAKAYMASRPYKVARRQDLVMYNNATKITPKLQIVPRVLKMDSQHQDLEADRQRTAWPAHHMPDLLQLLPKRISILEHDIGLGGPLQHVEKIDLKEKSSGSIKSPTNRMLDILHGQVVRILEKGDSLRLLSYPLNEPALKLSVEPPHKKRAFRTSVPGSDSALAADIMSAPEDDSFEIDDTLAADIVATSTLLGVSLTPALVENNKQMFPKVVKVLEQAEPKALELTRLG
nr:hypothetical protein [Tanacetum cinerariifolium]